MPADGSFELKESVVRLSLSYGNSPLKSRVRFASPDIAVAAMREVMMELDREMSCVINLNTKMEPLSYSIVAVGDTSSSVLPLMNIFKTAILSNAYAVMVLHNHPSGDVTPSTADIAATLRTIDAGRLLEIPVIDHIIVGAGDGELFSFKAEMPELFTGSVNYTIRAEMIRSGLAEKTIEYGDNEMNKLDFINFTRWAVHTVQANLSGMLENAEVNCREVERSDGTYTGIYLSLPDIGTQASPVANLDRIYNEYANNGMPLEAAKGMLLSTVLGYRLNTLELVDRFSDYEKVKGSLFISLSGINTNREMLSHVPHRIAEDMVILYRVLVDISENGIASAVVTNEMLENLGVSAETLERDAMLNSENVFPSRCFSLDSVVLSFDRPEGLTEMLPGTADGITVVTNDRGIGGASALFYPGMLERISEYYGGDFCVLPSSEHEMLIVPESLTDLKNLRDMVTAINLGVVRESDRLTDNAYHYDSREKLLESAETYEKRLMGERTDSGYRAPDYSSDMGISTAAVRDEPDGRELRSR